MMVKIVWFRLNDLKYGMFTASCADLLKIKITLLNTAPAGEKSYYLFNYKRPRNKSTSADESEF